MRVLIPALVAAALALPAAAQAPAAPAAPVPPKTFTSAAEVQSIIAAAKARRKDEPTISTPLMRSGSHASNIEYRASAGPAAIHPDSEMFYVVEGAGTMTTGGRIVDRAIVDGSSRRIAKGDFLLVPPETPHQVTAVEGSVSLMAVRVPK